MDIHIKGNANKEEIMELNKEQLTKIVGGVSGAVLSTIVRGFKLAFDMGRHLGSSIRRFFTRNYC